MLQVGMHDPDKLVRVAHALSTRARVDMLRLLNDRSLNVLEMSEALSLPVSTVANNVKILEAAELIHTELLPAVRGAMKVCTRSYDDVHVALNPKFSQMIGDTYLYQIEMPIGQYSNCEVYPTCGMASREEFLVTEDEPASFYHPLHINASIIWFRKGFVEYLLPLEIPQQATIEAIEFSMELCSEAPNFDHDWPSDISLWVNDVELGYWTSPGDFGERKGKLNPAWWAERTHTQYGLLKTWRIDQEKTTLDMAKLSDVILSDLQLERRPSIKLKIGVKQDAVHRGGVNLFGKHFGDYEQDIMMKVHYKIDV